MLTFAILLTLTPAGVGGGGVSGLGGVSSMGATSGLSANILSRSICTGRHMRRKKMNANKHLNIFSFDAVLSGEGTASNVLNYNEWLQHLCITIRED